MLAFVTSGEAARVTIAGASDLRATISGYLMDEPE